MIDEDMDQSRVTDILTSNNKEFWTNQRDKMCLLQQNKIDASIKWL